MRKPVIHQMRTKAQIILCIRAESDQCLCCSLPSSMIPACTCLIQNFKTLAGCCSKAGRFESYLVENSKDKFSPDMAHVVIFFSESSESAHQNRQSPESPQKTQSSEQPGTAQKSHKKKRGNKKSGNQTSAKASDTKNRTEEEEPDNIPSAHESIEAMKNILLENFLSDFCEEMGFGAMANMDLGSLPEMGLDENDENLEGDDVTFDEDPLELLMNITDTGSTTNTYVKESILKTNVNDNADDKTESNKKKKSRSRRRKKGKKSGNSETQVSKEVQNISKEDDRKTSNKSVSETEKVAEDKSETESKVSPKSNEDMREEDNENKEAVAASEVKQNVSDSEEVSIKEPKDTQDETDTSEHNEETFSGKLLYPGEVDDDDMTTSVSKETRLEFKATYRDPPEDNSPPTIQV